MKRKSWRLPTFSISPAPFAKFSSLFFRAGVLTEWQGPGVEECAEDVARQVIHHQMDLEWARPVVQDRLETRDHLPSVICGGRYEADLHRLENVTTYIHNMSEVREQPVEKLNVERNTS